MPMTRLTFAALPIMLGTAVAAHAADPRYVTERGRLMCTTQGSYAEAQRAIEARDKGWLDSIKGCTQSQAGLKAEIIQGGMLTAKIRVYDDAGKPTDYITSPTTVKEVRR
jgi:hypothetical protein